MADINYSIIIPHKNIPDLLRRCLNSIPRRDDIQIIVVDDNSDEDKVDFKHFPGVGEKCVEVYFTKEGRGAGYARNVGLTHAKGKWLLFADADDFYVQDAWDYFDNYLNAQIDILYFGVKCVDSFTLLPASRELNNNTVIATFLSGEKEGEQLLRYTCWEPWNKMWNHDFVSSNQLQFEEILRGNDAMFVLHGGDKARVVNAIDNQLYVVTYRSQSLSYRVTKESLFSSLQLRIRINKFYKKRSLSKLRVSILSDIFQIYKHFGLKMALKATFLVFKERGDFFIFFFDTDGWKQLFRQIYVSLLIF